MSELVAFFILLGLYLAVGYPLYRDRWPEGFIPGDPEPDYLDIARRGRRRVLPLPERQAARRAP